MTHGKTLFARKLIEAWEKQYPGASIQVIDPKEMKHKAGPSRMPQSLHIHAHSWYQFRGGSDVCN